MNEELININKEILFKGMFSLKFSEEDDQITQEIEALELKKKEIEDKLLSISKKKIKEITEYKDKLIEIESKYRLNLEDLNDEHSITDKIEQYKTYKVIYDEHYKYIEAVKGLFITYKIYNNVDYDYLITKI